MSATRSGLDFDEVCTVIRTAVPASPLDRLSHGALVVIEQEEAMDLETWRRAEDDHESVRRRTGTHLRERGSWCLPHGVRRGQQKLTRGTRLGGVVKLGSTAGFPTTSRQDLARLAGRTRWSGSSGVSFQPNCPGR